MLDSTKAGQLLGMTQPQIAIVAEDSGTVIAIPSEVHQNFNLVAH